MGTENNNGEGVLMSTKDYRVQLIVAKLILHRYYADDAGELVGEHICKY